MLKHNMLTKPVHAVTEFTKFGSKHIRIVVSARERTDDKIMQACSTPV